MFIFWKDLCNYFGCVETVQFHFCKRSVSVLPASQVLVRFASEQFYIQRIYFSLHILLICMYIFACIYAWSLGDFVNFHQRCLHTGVPTHHIYGNERDIIPPCLCLVEILYLLSPRGGWYRPEVFQGPILGAPVSRCVPVSTVAGCIQNHIYIYTALPERGTIGCNEIYEVYMYVT